MNLNWVPETCGGGIHRFTLMTPAVLKCRDCFAYLCDKEICEFVAAYAERSEVDPDELLEYQIPLPCNCGDEECDGWAMVGRHPLMVKAHVELYSRPHVLV